MCDMKHKHEILLRFAETAEHGEEIAKILTSLEYEEASDHFYDLFSWIEDLNTPGAMQVFEYLKKAPAELLYPEFKTAAEASLKMQSRSLFLNLCELLSCNSGLYRILKSNDPKLCKLFF
ncbi:MAG: DUF5071 domain-containing protein [Ruminococcaceae bacterium]|nr:DUF5071 domain-containing protein [Oscillospiraceae bacterium]